MRGVLLLNRIAAVAGVACLFLMTLGARCEAPDLLEPDRNRPPDTFLSRGPEQDEVTHFRVHLFWKGFDPDGTVAEWQFAIDDTIVRPEAEVVGTGWIRTTKTDSLFIFQASDDGTSTQKQHRFFVASIDNERKADPTPSVLDFGARTVFYPEPEVTAGPAEGETLTVFSSVTLCWGGVDRDGEIVKMSYKLNPIDLGFTTVRTGEQTCATYSNLPSNASREAYQFLLIAEDDAGARNLRAVERRFVVNHDPNTTITRFYSSGPFGVDSDIMPGDTIPDSSSVDFEWEADDVDGSIKGAFWAISSSKSIFSDPTLRDSARTRADKAKDLVSDVSSALLVVGSVDEYGRAEGSPDSIPFFVNFPPSVQITKPATVAVTVTDGRLTVEWQGSDRDGPIGRIEYDIEVVDPNGNSVRRTISDDQPDLFRLTDVSRGLYTFRVTPTDRRGEGKTGRTAEKTIVVSTGGAGAPAATSRRSVQ